MKVRGHRECKECGNRWTYYETGTVSCPACGSHHSVGIDDDRSLHTATTATLDLTPLRGAIDSEPVARLADRTVERVRDLTRGYGFIDAGRLQTLDDTYLAAMELKYVADELTRRVNHTDDEEWYFTQLLRADEGARPDPADVPQTMRALRGLGYANAVRAYRSDLRTYLGEHPDETVDGVLERLGIHVRRVQALDGDVPPRESERLVAAARSIGGYLADGDERELTVAEQRLDSLE